MSGFCGRFISKYSTRLFDKKRKKTDGQLFCVYAFVEKRKENH